MEVRISMFRDEPEGDSRAGKRQSTNATISVTLVLEKLGILDVAHV